jgi:hypothetical protein
MPPELLKSSAENENENGNERGEAREEIEWHEGKGKNRCKGVTAIWGGGVNG